MYNKQGINRIFIIKSEVKIQSRIKKKINYIEVIELVVQILLVLGVVVFIFFGNLLEMQNFQRFYRYIEFKLYFIRFRSFFVCIIYRERY